VLLAVLAHANYCGWRIATNHEHGRTCTALHEHPRSITFHSLEGARDASLPVEGTQGDTEHRPIHLGAVLSGKTGRHDLDEAHPGAPVHGFANRRAGDKGRHAVVDQPRHHVALVVRRLRSREADAGGCLHDPIVALVRGSGPEPKVPSKD